MIVNLISAIRLHIAGVSTIFDHSDIAALLPFTIHHASLIFLFRILSFSRCRSDDHCNIVIFQIFCCFICSTDQTIDKLVLSGFHHY